MRAVAECDPRSLHGKAWSELTYEQQIELMAYCQLRMEERAGPEEEDNG